jgi:hypothetical protein
MRNWKLTLDNPLNLILAADHRLTELNYANDQIWELLLGSGEPPAVALHTTYGLRARSMRVFPQFVEAHQSVSDPGDFDSPVIITHFAPNYLKLMFSPFPDIDVEMEYWLPDGQTAAGRIWVRNTGDLDRKLRMELTALLSPNPEGKPSVVRVKESAQILQGATENLAPVLFITGGASGENSPYPHLYHDLEMAPDAYRRFTWALAALGDDEESFRHARLTAARNWEAEITRIRMLARQTLEIHTGDPDWDAALAFSQKTAQLLCFSPNQHLPHTTFVSTRMPDMGYSRQGSGSDYSHLWSGQSAFESWVLGQTLVPDSAQAARSLLDNFFSVQKENGFIDHKIGLGGQRTSLDASPLLVSLCWLYYEYTQDLDYLKQNFRRLLWHIQTWFSESNDRDGDGIPEWSNLVQTGYDENPAFSRWQPWDRGADIRMVESPDLCAYLYREITLLQKIARMVGETEPLTYLEAMAATLHTAVQNSWNSRRATYQYWDYENHQTSTGEVLQERTGPGEMLVDQVFETPTRLQLKLTSPEPPTAKLEITLHGSSPNGQHRVETISAADLTWAADGAIFTLPNLYAEIEHVHIQGLAAEGTAQIQIVDLYQEDHTLLTPIWAGIPSEEQVEKIYDRRLAKASGYGRQYGIPAQPRASTKAEEEAVMRVWLPYNAMVAEGLLDYGRVTEATDLFTRNMASVVENLKSEQAFRSQYHAERAGGVGQRNHVTGLPSIQLFLKILGIKPLITGGVQVHHPNPYPWPVRLIYRGTVIESSEESVMIRFPNRESIIVAAGEMPCLIENKAVPMEVLP